MSESAWERRANRERKARELAEHLLEEKSLELYSANQKANALNATLEDRVKLRIAELADANARLRDEMQQRQDAQDELRITQFAVDRCADAVYWVDSDANFIYANDAACRAAGYSHSEITKLRVFDLDAEMSPSAWPEHWRELCNHKSLTIESIHVSRSGERFPVEVSANYVKVDGVEYNCVFARDISERVAERSRRDRVSALNRVVQDLTQYLVKSQDLSEAINYILSEMGNHLDVSRAYFMRFRDGEQLVYNTHEWTSDGFPSQSSRFQDVPISEFGWWIDELGTGKPIVISNLNETILPDRISVALRRYQTQAVLSVPIILNGRLTGLLGFDQVGHHRDWMDEEVSLLLTVVESLSRAIERHIAERAQEQHRIELSESLRRETIANKAKSSFLANMSHEIRTPMTAILGYADMLTRPNISTAEQQEWATQTRRSAEHLLGLLNDILDLSKIEAGELTISHETFLLSDILDDVTSVLRPFASEKMLDLRVNRSFRSDLKLHSDPTRLRQVLINLVHNAIKFTDYGSITINAHEDVADTPDGQESRLNFAVIDTGVGVPPEKLEDIFRPFSQIKQSQPSAGGGVGLGLTICRHLVNMLGGTLSARNIEQGGSEFVFDILASESSELNPSKSFAAEDDPSLEHAALDHSRVLVVDDNPDNQRIIRFLLDEMNIEVTQAMNGQEAVDITLSLNPGSNFDAVLMDIQMPVLDGYSATRIMRENGVDIPIIALTAHAMAEDKARCLIVGCNDYVSKPIVPDSLYHSLAKLISKKSQEPQQKSVEFPADEHQPLISTMAGNEKFRPLLESYLESLEASLSNLNEFIGAQDWSSVQSLAHRLRGTGTSHGFPMITEAAGECEDLIRNDSPVDEVQLSAEVLSRVLRSATQF